MRWLPQDEPPQFEAERPAALDWTLRHLPAVIRVFSLGQLVPPPRMSEAEAYEAVRELTDQRIRQKIGRSRFRQPWMKDHTFQLATWLRLSPLALKWWKSHWGWRAPKEFVGWRLEEDGRAHIEPFEVATLRLPEDVVMDADVILLQAWAQGFTGRFMPHLTVATWAPWESSIRAGLRKLHASPWVQFAIAAQNMAPVGIDINGTGVMASAVRMEALLRHPFTATLGELEFILATEFFRAGYERARRQRRAGRVVLPDGGWYACGRASALGQWFHRGAMWTASGSWVEQERRSRRPSA